MIILKDKKKRYFFLPLLLVLSMFFLQPAGEAIAARSTPGFSIGDMPFHFIGGFLPGWHWGDEFWSVPVDDDLITSARNTGMTVMHIMLPQFEGLLGDYDETKLQRLDHFLNSAYNANMYVMPSFIQAYGGTLEPSNPYYHERSIEGIIKDPTLREGFTLREYFKKRIEHLVNRTNTINGRPYKNDPTIMAWIICDEPISAPFNYPNGVPQVTLEELIDWFRETASYIKSMDSNHLVTVWSQPAIQEFFGGTSDYLQALGIPEFDFLYTEDADLSIVPGLTQGYGCTGVTSDYMLEQFLPGKPVAFHPAFTSGCWDKNVICDDDFTVQATNLNLAIPEYFEIGGNGVFIQNWGTDLYSSVPDFAVCYNYTDSYPQIVDTVRTHSTLINPNAYPVGPLEFVRVIYGLNVAKSGSGSGTVNSNPAGVACGSDCSEALIQGSVVTLTVQTDADSIFTGWSDGGCSGTGACEVTMNSEITVTATFTLASFPPELSPNEGTIGTELTITGTGFGDKKGKVLIGGVAAKVTSWADTLIMGTVKKVPLPIEQPHDVLITSKTIGTITLDNAFTVMGPELDTLTDSAGRPGEEITVTGNFFGIKKGKVYLEYLSNEQTKKKNCKVTWWYMNLTTGASEVRFIVPKVSKTLPAGDYPLKVYNKIGTATADTDFTILP
jgi:hypothetical protein